jgi:hypothetical protein
MSYYAPFKSYEEWREHKRLAWHAANDARVGKQAERRRQRHAALQHDFAAYGGRDNWIWHQGQTRTFASIADEIGLSRERVRNIFDQADRRKAWRATIAPFDLVRRDTSRPLDMGGPRDVWLTFYPSADPRVDNMAPVDPEIDLRALK